MSDGLEFSDFTTREQARLGLNVVRMALGGNLTKAQRRIERLEKQAARRKQQGK